MGSWTASDGARLSYDESGSGVPPAVLLHGWQSTRATWAAMGELLRVRRRTIVVDLRGCGASAEAPPPYTVERSAEDIAALLRDVVGERAIVVGHSMGGAIALRLALDDPEFVAGIVLIAPVPPSGLQFPPHVDDVFRATAGNVNNFERWLRRNTLEPLPDAVFASLSKAAATVKADVALEGYASWTRLDFARAVRRIRAPVLVMPGDSDKPYLTPQRLRELIVDRIRGAQMRVIERSGHYVPLEQPARAAEEIERFIERVTG